MSMMRDLMKLTEGMAQPSTTPGISPGVAAHTAGKGKRLEGTFLNPDMMLQYFPSVQDKQAFNRAWRKVTANKEEDLQRLEMFEIARAFCDILRMPDEDKLSFMRRLMNVGPGDSIGADETARTIYR